MKLEFHQLDRRYEHLRARSPERQRRLLVSLAASGQQTPIIVVAVSDRYLVIDGYKRVAALEQLSRDTVEAVVWDMNEADALVLDRSMRFSEQETALEQGWLLQELEQRFGYSLEDLARRFDRSVSWVSRRLALVEQLPETVQQRVRAGEISAHVAMKYLAPVARAIEKEHEHVEPKSTDHDSGTPRPGRFQSRDCARSEHIAPERAQSPTSELIGLAVLVRPEKAEAYRIQILELLATHKGNLVRVHEELVSRGADVSYQSLTAFCRRHGIAQEPKAASGQYHFEPAEELQHDTSPHETEIGGKKRKIQTASAVLCYSRMVFFQCYPTFQRFDCKVFLTDALRYFGGSVERVMIDNTHIVVLRGTGAAMVPVPEMEAFAERFGFRFAAHERGDANRSARVERPFDFIDNNFLAGRTFSGWEDLNQQARQWCDRVNGTYKKHLRAVPRELFAVERLHLKPLPVWIPEVYRLHERIVDVEGYVALHTSRYSVPVAWIGRRVEVRETKDKLEIQLDPRHIVTHQRVPEGEYQRITLAEHRPPRGQGIKRTDPYPEEEAILQAAPELADYLAALKKRGHRYLTIALRQLLRIVREYPRPPVLSAASAGGRSGLYDLDRLERMVLRRIARDYFLLESKGTPDEDQ